MLKRALLGAVLATVCGPAAAAHATGIFQITGSTIVYQSDPGDVDQIAAFATPSTIRFTRFGGAGLGPGPGCNFVGSDSNTIDCVKGGVTAVVLNLGDGDDVADVSPALTVPVIFNGGPGRDGLFGGGGLDVFDGGPGDDDIVSRDGRGEQVDCGDGHDTAISDDADARISCEEIEGDADGDGVRRPADCDDTRPGVRPGAADVPENGVDEDCSGADAVNRDRDGDGVPRPQDCNDGDPSIRPGAREIIGNDADENCDGLIEPTPPLTGTVLTKWDKIGGQTRNVKLLAKGFPAGTLISLRCTGSSECPKAPSKRTVGRDRKAVNLHLLLRRRTFSKRTRIEIDISRDARVGRVLRYDMSKPGVPKVQFLCRPPGGAAGAC